jgi:hypothetical protein
VVAAANNGYSYVAVDVSFVIAAPVTVLAIVIEPEPGVIDIPVPAVSLVTPVLTNVITPLLVIGPPDTAIPVPALIPTLVTVPDPTVLAILVILPYWSTVTVAAVYSPGVTPVEGRLIAMLPLLTIGLLVTVNEFDVTPTLVTPATMLPLASPVTETMTSPLDPDNVIPVPGTSLVTPVLVKVTVFAVVCTALIPVLETKLVTELALLNRLLKLFCILLKAMYRESLPIDWFCVPILMNC